MKPLKFRVWDIDRKKYSNGTFYVHQDGSLLLNFYGDDLYDPCSRVNIEEEQYIIEYYAGVFDKNGKEIYEGDIIKASGISYPWAIILNEIDGYWVSNTKIGVKYRLLDLFNSNLPIQIIGNINQNPELLHETA